MKNYKNFLNEYKSKLSVYNINENDIVRIDIMKDGKSIEKVYPFNNKEFTKNANFNLFENLPKDNVITHTSTRKNMYIKIYLIGEEFGVKNEPYIFNITLTIFNQLNISKNPKKDGKNLKKEYAGKNIEHIQSIGFLYNKDNIPTSYENIKKSDFDTSLIDDIKIDENPIKNKIDFKLFLGSLKFKNYIKNDLSKYLKTEKNFNIEYILHINKKDFIKKLQKNEKEVSNVIGVEFNEDKLNTTDLFLFDKKYSEYDLVDSIVLSEPAKKITLFDKEIYIGGICHVIKNKDVNLEKLKNIKETYKDDIEKYEKLISKIISQYPDSPRFIQISLKKDKLNAHFGKVTRTIKKIFEDEKLNEGVFDFIIKIKDYISKKFKSLFNKYNIVLNNYNNVYKTNMQNKIENDLNNISESVETKLYNSKQFNDGIFGDLFIYNRNVELNKLKNIENKQKVSVDIDLLIEKIIKSASYLKNHDSESFHEKFAELLTVSIMGATNLPLFMVFGTDKIDELSFTLHTYRINKKISQINQTIEKINEKYPIPLYAIIINNYIQNNEVIYRSANILSYNFSSTDNKYISFTARSSSSSHKSFAVDTTVLKGNIVKNMLSEYLKYII